MNNLIYPCLILKGRATEAASFYSNTFNDVVITDTNPVVTQLKIGEQKLMLLNDGPPTMPNPSISFMVSSPTEQETDRYWEKLSEGGEVIMPLDTYEWSRKYGWIQDKFGVSWQLITASEGDVGQRISPTLMFTGTNAGKAREAINLYTGLFPESGITGILNYSDGDGDDTSFVKHSQFTIDGYLLIAMDSSSDHSHVFNDAISFVVDCESQQMIDLYWQCLVDNGGSELACGWLKDKYGIRWQILPDSLGALMSDPMKGARVMQALFQMKKINVAELENA